MFSVSLNLSDFSKSAKQKITCLLSTFMYFVKASDNIYWPVNPTWTVHQSFSVSIMRHFGKLFLDLVRVRVSSWQPQNNTAQRVKGPGLRWDWIIAARMVLAISWTSWVPGLALDGGQRLRRDLWCVGKTQPCSLWMCALLRKDSDRSLTWTQIHCKLLNLFSKFYNTLTSWKNSILALRSTWNALCIPFYMHNVTDFWM